MKKLKTILISVGVAFLVTAIGALIYYVYESINYFSTQNAQVTADMVTLTPEITGKLKELNIQVGDQVQAGQIIGRQDVGSVISSTALSPQSLANSADSMIAKADIKAPISGQVVAVNVVKGQVLTTGMEIATIAATDHIYIKANIEETDIFNIQPGQKVDIKIDAYPGKKFSGYVDTIGMATNSAFNTTIALTTSNTFSKVTQLIPVQIAIDNPDDLILMPGMNATVKIHIK